MRTYGSSNSNIPTAWFELANTRRCTPACRDASKTLYVATMLFGSTDSHGACMPASAARCTTASMPSKARRIASKLLTSATVVGISGASADWTRSSPEKVYLSPRVRMTTPPMRPLEPVTSTFSMISSLLAFPLASSRTAGHWLHGEVGHNLVREAFHHALRIGVAIGAEVEVQNDL